MTDPVAADARRIKNSIIIYVILTAALSSIFYSLVIHRSSAGRGTPSRYNCFAIWPTGPLKRLQPLRG
jgi:hypothetical protein